MESPPQDRRAELEGFILPNDPITEGFVEVTPGGITIRYSVTATVGPLQFDFVLDVNSPQVVLSAKMTDLMLAYEMEWKLTDDTPDMPQWVLRAQVGALVLHAVAMRTSGQLRTRLNGLLLGHHPGFTGRLPRT